MVNVGPGLAAAMGGYQSLQDQANREGTINRFRTVRAGDAFAGAVGDVTQKLDEKRGLEALQGLGEKFGIPRDSPVWQSPATAKAALLQAMKTKMDADAENTRYGHEADLNSQRFAQDKMLKETQGGIDKAAKETERKASEAADLAAGKQLGEFTAPVQGYGAFAPGVTPAGGVPGGFAPPGMDELDRRAQTGKFPMSVILKARDEARKSVQKPAGLSPYDEEMGRLKARKEMGAGDFKPVDPKETPEARLARFEAESKARAQGTAAGTPAKPAVAPRPSAVYADEQAIGRMALSEPQRAKLGQLEATIREYGNLRPQEQADYDAIVAIKEAAIAKSRVGGGSPAAAHPSGASPDKVQKLEAAGYRWNGTGWVK